MTDRRMEEPNTDEWYGEELHHMAELPAQYDNSELGDVQLPPKYMVKKQDLDATFSVPSSDQKGKLCQYCDCFVMKF